MEQVVNVVRKSCNSRANVRNPSLLKVSKSRNQFLEFATLPKNERKVENKYLESFKAYVSEEILNWHCLSLNANLCIHFY